MINNLIAHKGVAYVRDLTVNFSVLKTAEYDNQAYLDIFHCNLDISKIQYPIDISHAQSFKVAISL